MNWSCYPVNPNEYNPLNAVISWAMSNIVLILILITVNQNHLYKSKSSNHKDFLCQFTLNLHSCFNIYSNALYVKLWTPICKRPIYPGLLNDANLHLCLILMIHSTILVFKLLVFMKFIVFKFCPMFNFGSQTLGPINPRTFVVQI